MKEDIEKGQKGKNKNLYYGQFSGKKIDRNEHQFRIIKHNISEYLDFKIE